MHEEEHPYNKKQGCDDESSVTEVNHTEKRQPETRKEETPSKPAFKWPSQVTINTISTAAMAIFTATLWITSCNQLDSMRKQTEIVQGQLDEMKASSRPWVNVRVEIVQGWESGSNIKAKYTMENVGGTPAIGVRIIPSAMLHHFGDASFGYGNLAAKQRELCLQGKQEVFGFGAPVLFPQEKWSEEIEVGLGPNKDVLAFSGLQPGFPYLLGCVTYRFAFDDKSVHQTPYVYALSRTKPKYVANSPSITFDFGPASSMGIFLAPVILKGASTPD